MPVEELIVLGIMGAALVAFFGYIVKTSQDLSIKILFIFIIIVILGLELWPFIKYALAEPNLSDIPVIIENLSSFLIASIGGLIFGSVFGG